VHAEADGAHQKSDAPARDAGLKAVTQRVTQVASAQKSHGSAVAKAGEAHVAAASPQAEREGHAAGSKVDTMGRQQPKPFSKEAFKAALLAKIEQLQPRTLDDADKFKKSGKAQQVKSDLAGTVAEGKKESGSDISSATAAPVAGAEPPRPGSPLPPAEPGPRPPDIHAVQAAPPPRPAAEVSLAAGPAKVARLQASVNVTDAQIRKSNEPTFNAALAAKQQAAAHAAAAPVALRKTEAAVLARTKNDAAAAAAAHLSGMHGARGQSLSKVLAHQAEAKARDEQARTKVGADVLKCYADTKAAVEARLAKLDADATAAFDAGTTRAQAEFEDYVDREVTLFKLERYVDNPLLWAYDLLKGPPEEVNKIYRDGRDVFLRKMDHVIDEVASIVEKGLTEAKNEIVKGKLALDAYVRGLDPSLQEVGKSAAAEIGDKFGALEQSVNEKRDGLIDSLSQKYVDALQKVDAKIEEMKAADKGLIDQALDAVDGLIETIKQLKAMLLGVLSRAGGTIDLVLADPIGFLGNLVSGVKLGFNNFVSKIGTYLQKGLLDWLFGALSAAGITMPQTFDLKGIFGLVMEVLGLTYANIRSRAVAIVGEKVVAGLEQAAGVFKILITQGPLGIWELIKEKIGDLKVMVIDQIKSFVMDKIIIAGVTWVIGLLNPASAFIKACKAIYDVVMFFVERGSQILALVNAVIDSVTAIAKGAIGVAANMVEGALAKAVPVVIGFLAGLLGLDGISEKIKKIIETIRKPINAAIDWVIHQAVKLVKAVAGLFKGGGEKAEKEGKSHEGVKGIANAMISERVTPNHSAAEVSQILAKILAELRPQGLQELRLGEPDETGSMPVMAMASPLEELRQFAPGDRQVVMGASVTMADLQDVGLLRSGHPYETLTGKEGGIAEARRLDPISIMYKGTQPSGGFQFKTEAGSREIKLLTWNTTESISGKVASHAEQQFVSWVYGQPDLHKKLEHIDLHISHSPCIAYLPEESCTQNLARLLVFLKKVNPAVSGRITYDTPFVRRRKGSPEVSVATLRTAGWEVVTPGDVNTEAVPLKS
jgi:hypothetical protein